MANTYTQLYIHFVFAVKNRQALIAKSWRNELEKYITGIVQDEGHKMLAIKTRPDHAHIFIGYKPTQLIPKLIETIKTHSNSWIKEKNLTSFKFDWQSGYGGFSHSRSQVDTVVNYILNQDIHHQGKTFKEEYLELLKRLEIDFKQEYLFDFFDDVIDEP